MTIAIDLIDDDVVLLDDFGTPIGTAPKSAAHGPDTALHLAFSCHVLNAEGEVLVTRRALTKQAWAGVWTNSFCGHPKPSEPLTAAVRRRAEFELGLELDSLELALPTFRYRAVDADGTVENEICPVYIATVSGEPDPNPREVVEYRWVRPAELRQAIEAAPWAFSPWLGLQAGRLELYRD
ncbi:isopentenyl-diphosphate Delta-isomerase [Agromyces aureus]|uniref:Isopentenyl-diphosphate Delta-isomerase n=1 Tax=Agromyces aureus TaxID=453304 RepID=A0A191WKZ8_9MICO|nr:isopentenyl-diphosphate Delta-isomerase [Agromyces aureus]ANJ28884.1 isopentenyl-diphosphate delta-isomerase [Agromyces aureus]